uniref:Uncharacterized protein n=1 Tax=Heterosigma akashiwo TaxID=2829 RepID=A0A7S3UPV4_HETAK
MTGENTIIIIIIRKNGEEITPGIEEGKLERSSKARKLTAVRKDQGIENMTTERVYHLGEKKEEAEVEVGIVATHHIQTQKEKEKKEAAGRRMNKVVEEEEMRITTTSATRRKNVDRRSIMVSMIEEEDNNQLLEQQE